ncbi:MAG: methyltransferase domain-containing protein [Chitinophagaceae bacterium]
MKDTLKKMLPDDVFHAIRDVKKNFQKKFYKGDAVYCVCCQSSFKAFAPFGVIKLPNRLCLECDSLERDRLLWMYLEKRTNLYKEPVRLLHVAPERLFFKKFSSLETIDYHPVDMYPSHYPEGTKFLDLLNNDVPSNSYDAIICNHVFQYIEEDKKAMKAVYEMLQPGGWAILQVPIDWKREVTYEDYTITDPKERERVYGLSEHVRWYGRDYPARLESIGFKVRADDFIESFTQAEIARYGFWKGQRIFYCVKD